VIFTYNRLMTDAELVVMRAAGVGPLGLAWPALALALAATGVVYALNLYFMPLATREYRDLRRLVESEYSTLLLRDGQFNAVAEGITVYFRERRRSGELAGILIHDNREPDRPATVVAERGVLIQTDIGPRVVMFDGNRQEADHLTGQISVLYFDEYAIDLEVLKPALKQRWKEPRERFIADLLHPDLSDPSDVRNERRLIAAGHERLSQPLLPIAFTCLALGALLSGEFNRRGQSRRVTIAALAVIVVQAAAMAFANLARQAPAAIALMYLLPLAASAFGIAMMFRRPHRRRGGLAAAPAPAE
jgi:lipopolysaccharide export system permease protein